MTLATVEEAAELYRRGELVIIVDDEDRENEGRPVHRRRQDHAGGDQLHGHVRPRPDLSRAHRGAMQGAGSAADGREQHLELRHGVHGFDRGARPRDDGHLGVRPIGNRSRRDRSEEPAGRSAPARPCLPAPRAQGRRAQTRRSDGGIGRSGVHRRDDSGRRHLRNHE